MSINLQNGAFMNLKSDEIIIVTVTHSMISSNNEDDESVVLAIADLTFSVRLETTITAANDAPDCTDEECEK